MEALLKIKLHAYLIENNPDLLVHLQEENKVTAYFEEKVKSVQPLLTRIISESEPPYMAEERCLHEMTADLRPSKYNYIRMILEEEFGSDFSSRDENSIIVYEIINIIGICNPLFEEYQFSEDNHDSRDLYYLVTGAINEYLENR